MIRDKLMKEHESSVPKKVEKFQLISVEKKAILEAPLSARKKLNRKRNMPANR